MMLSMKPDCAGNAEEEVELRTSRQVSSSERTIALTAFASTCRCRCNRGNIV